ncbi:unnamed protein product, partial [Urochloa humidicola]
YYPPPSTVQRAATGLARPTPSLPAPSRVATAAGGPRAGTGAARGGHRRPLSRASTGRRPYDEQRLEEALYSEKSAPRTPAASTPASASVSGLEERLRWFQRPRPRIRSVRASLLTSPCASSFFPPPTPGAPPSWPSRLLASTAWSPSSKNGREGDSLVTSRNGRKKAEVMADGRDLSCSSSIVTQPRSQFPICIDPVASPVAPLPHRPPRSYRCHPAYTSQPGESSLPSRIGACYGVCAQHGGIRELEGDCRAVGLRCAAQLLLEYHEIKNILLQILALITPTARWLPDLRTQSSWCSIFNRCWRPQISFQKKTNVDKAASVLST